LLGFYVLVFVPLIGVVYSRRGRLRGGVGWALLVGGQLFLLLGGGSLFAWAGLVSFFVSGFGLLLVAADLVTLYQARWRRRPR
jgi:hypothetical protein